MSATHEITVCIRCDMCPAREQAVGITTTQLRRKLQSMGWTRVTHYYIADYCPACSAKRAAALAGLDALREHKVMCAARTSCGREPCNCAQWEWTPEGRWIQKEPA